MEPGDAAPALRRPLTECSLLEAAGEQDARALTAVELAFCQLAGVAPEAFARCSRLRELTIIESRLEGSALAPFADLGATLRRLCIVSNRVTSLVAGGAGFPCLTELFLQDNAIARLDGIEACPCVQRLWISSNRVSSLTPLRHLPDLRELCAQDNCLGDSSMGVLSNLGSLSALDLTGNDLRSFRCLEPLVELRALAHLSLADAHFPPAPISAHSQYRDEVLVHLPQLASLDGVPVDAASRESARDCVLQDAFELEEALEALERKHALDELELRRQVLQCVAARIYIIYIYMYIYIYIHTYIHI